MSRTEKSVAFCVVGAGLVIILLAVIGIGVVAAADVAKARKIATGLQAAVVAHPNPVVSSPASATSATSDQASVSAAPAAPAASHGSSPTTGAANPAYVAAAAARGAVASAALPAATPSTSGRPTTVAGPVAGAVTPVTAGAKAPAKTTASRTVPTAAEVQQAITAVRAIIPFYTPTPTDIATAGNEVCTALDQGESLAQVQAAALGMIGASSYASFIPSADTQVAIQTLVSLYCPGYASRVG